jgi:hypothetical protein
LAFGEDTAISTLKVPMRVTMIAVAFIGLHHWRRPGDVRHGRGNVSDRPRDDQRHGARDERRAERD